MSRDGKTLGTTIMMAHGKIKNSRESSLKALRQHSGRWHCKCLAGESEQEAWIQVQSSLRELRGILVDVFANSLRHKVALNPC